VAEGKDLTGRSLAAQSRSPPTPAQPYFATRSRRSPTAISRNGRYLGLELIYARPNRQTHSHLPRAVHRKFNLPIQVTASRTTTSAATHIFASARIHRGLGIYGNQTRWSLRYEYRIARCIIEQPATFAPAKNVLLPGLDRDATNVSISSITPAFFWDKPTTRSNPHLGCCHVGVDRYASAIAANAAS